MLATESDRSGEREEERGKEEKQREEKERDRERGPERKWSSSGKKVKETSAASHVASGTVEFGVLLVRKV